MKNTMTQLIAIQSLIKMEVDRKSTKAAMVEILGQDFQFI